MIVAMFFVIGLYSMSMLSMELTPDMEMKYALVMTTYSNVSPSEIETEITENIESAVSSVDGVKSITSQSSQGSSIVMMEFSNDTDMDQAVNDIKDTVDMYSAMLPDDADDPTVMKLSTDMMPSVIMSVTYEGYTPSQTKKYVEDNVENHLEAVSGVASVSVIGAQDRIIKVEPDPQKLYGYNLSASDIISAVSAQNQNISAGSTEGMGKDMSVRAIGKFESMSDIESVPISTTSGQVIYLRDVASVSDTYDEVSSYSRLDGEDAISIMITEASDSNTVDTVNEILDTMESIAASDSKFTYNVISESGSYIEDSINSVASNAITGAILAIIVLLLFLGNVRSALIIGISMPTSVITTFIGMYFSGMSLNVVSLGGLALGVGMLVDNSVVVLENIFRHRTALNEDGPTAAIKGSGEVVGAVVASVLTTCIVYVPLLFVDNMMAVMFKQLGFTIIFSQVSSLIVTFLLVPMLSARIEKVGEMDRRLRWILVPFEKGLNQLYKFYDKTIRWVLTHRKSFLTAVLVIFVLSLVELSRLGMTLMPTSDEGTLSISIELPAGTQLEATNEIAQQVEEIVMQNPYVETVYASVGSSGSVMSGGGESASLTVNMVDEDERDGYSTEDIGEQIREQTKDISGAEITFEASSSMGITSDSIEYEYYTTGSDSELEEYVNQLADVMAGIDGIKEVSTSISDTQPEVRINVDVNRASRYGLTTSTAATLIRYALYDTTVSTYDDDGTEYDIKLIYPDDYCGDYREIENIRIKSPVGTWINVSDIADVTVEQSATTLQRVDQKRTLTIEGKIYGTDMSTVSAAYEEAIKDIPVPEGVGMNTSGSMETMMEAMQSLVLAIALGILLMYMVMAMQFESLSEPFIILFTLPLAMIGVVLSLMVARSPLSVISCIGILMLVGIVVNNAIVLIDFIKTSKAEGKFDNRVNLLADAGRTRMRPIHMSTITSILGYMPMAVNASEGGTTMQPLAVVLLGGLAVGTVLTLYVIPTIYSIFDDRAIKRARKKEARKARRRAKEAAAV